MIKVTWFFLLILLASCNTRHPTHQTSVDQSISILRNSANQNQTLGQKGSHQALPKYVNNALLPPISRYMRSRPGEPHFDVAANKIPAKEFFMGLVAGTKYNMIVHPEITGTITLNLKDVTLHQTMEAIHDIYGYQYHRTSYGYEILPPQLETQLFHVNYLDVKRTGRSYTQLTTGQVSNKVGTVTTGSSGGNSNPTPAPSGGQSVEGVGTISTVETKTEMQFWKDLEKAVQNMIPNDKDHYVTVNSQSGIIAVRAYPMELRRVMRFINLLQSSLNRQVILEAKILEVNLNDQFQAGIDWSILGNPAAAGLNSTGSNDAGIGQSANSLFPDTDLNQLAGIFAFKVNGNFKLLIELLQTQGNVQVLSSPRISTVNNQKAVIKVGSDEFFVTGVSTSNTIIGTNTLPSQDVSLTPFFSGVTLDVTPEISKENAVILHIHPSVSNVTQQTKTILLGSSGQNSPNTLVLPLAFSTIRESDNIVSAKNGQVVVIGGLMQNNMTETIAETPWISKIPFIGALFRRTLQVSTKTELVILLRPIIASNKNIIKDIESEKDIFQIYKRPFHTGGLPKVFGDEAEYQDTN